MWINFFFNYQLRQNITGKCLGNRAAVFAILISCLGLFGMASFIAELHSGWFYQRSTGIALCSRQVVDQGSASACKTKPKPVYRLIYAGCINIDGRILVGGVAEQ
jgi:hypothetical protein